MAEPTTWIGVASLGVLTVGGWGKAWIDARRHNRAVGGIRDQLYNGHETNLRDDLDGVVDGVRGIRDDIGEMRRDMRGFRGDLGGIRGELRAERQARSDLERRIDDHLRDR